MEAAGGRVRRSGGVSTRLACAAMPRRLQSARRCSPHRHALAITGGASAATVEHSRIRWAHVVAEAPAGGTNDAKAGRKRHRQRHIEMCIHVTQWTWYAAQDKRTGVRVASPRVGAVCVVWGLAVVGLSMLWRRDDVFVLRVSVKCTVKSQPKAKLGRVGVKNL